MNRSKTNHHPFPPSPTPPLSVFFLGYCGAQVPLVAACLASRGGVVPCLAACCAAWGLAAAATAFVASPAAFYAARVVLGVAESASFPLVWAYLHAFYPGQAELGAAYSAVTATIAAAQVAGGPLAALILSVRSTRLAGWQLLFVAEAAPTLAVAAWTFLSLPRSPATATFLPPDAQRWLVARHRALAASSPPAPRFAALASRKLWCLGGLEAVVSAAKYALLFFAPLLVDALLTGAAVEHGSGAGGAHTAPPPPPHRAAAVAALTSIPFGLAAVTTVVNAHHAKRTRERRWHVVWPVCACAVGLALLAATIGRSAAGALLALVVGLQVYGATGVVATYPASIFGEREEKRGGMEKGGAFLFRSTKRRNHQPLPPTPHPLFPPRSRWRRRRHRLRPRQRRRQRGRPGRARAVWRAARRDGILCRALRRHGGRRGGGSGRVRRRFAVAGGRRRRGWGAAARESGRGRGRRVAAGVGEKEKEVDPSFCLLCFSWIVAGVVFGG